jgi:predicted aldo/keto reductase-like oxidoreductase
MQYRKFGRVDFMASILGFGAMRLPILDGDDSKIDEPKAIELIRYAADQGVNYLDTAYNYHQGRSEEVLGRALRDGYRARVKLATKMPVWKAQKKEDFQTLLEEQLSRLSTERIDFYLLHGLGSKSWPKVRDLGVMEWAEKRKRSGEIGEIGFSFHDSLEAFRAIVDDYGWSFCLIQYNYMGIADQAGRAGLEYASSRGMAVLVMGPLKGGRLAGAPAKVKSIWAQAETQRSPAAWALRWVWNHPQVTVALSGMGDLKELKENLAAAEEAGVNVMSEEELRTIDQVRAAYAESMAVNCTECKYCLPCPTGVEISRIFSIYNDAERFENYGDPAFAYRYFLKPEQRAEACNQCGECEDKCPQGLPIREWLGKISQAFSAPPR